MKRFRTIKPVEARERRIPLDLEELSRAAKRQPYCGFFRLNKETANDWFANHLDSDHQRSLSEDQINVLLRLQAEDLWTDYKPEVVFDTRWNIRNGQHVLASLIRSTTHNEFIIKLLFNLPPSVCDSWDLVRKRSAADEFKIKGLTEHRYMFSKAAKVLWQYLHGVYNGTGYQFDRSTAKIAVAPEAVRVAEQNPDLRQCLFPMGKCFKGKQFSAAAIYAAFCILRRLDAPKAEAFFRALNDGVGLSGRNDPIWALRNRFLSMQPEERLRNGETMALVFKTWNLYLEGKPVSGALKMGKNEPFPKLEPMEIPNGPRHGTTH